MNFSTLLNDYIEKLNCTSKELSKASGISETVISRYKSGDRTPKYDSKQFNDLINGIIKIAKERNINIEKVKDDFDKIYNTINIDTFKNNLNILIKELKINVADLSRYLGFDASYLSKIKNGERIPKNMNDFINGICKYISENYRRGEDKEKLSNIIGYNLSDEYNNDLINWICNDNKIENNATSSFLEKLDDFDLNDYIKAIKFDKLKVPTMPINFPKSKNYYGLEGFKNSQLDTLKGIVLSKSKEDIFFYSNMPMTEASKDLDFTKKFMFGLALILKKGQHINIIHNLDRPFNELMMGLEGWIPLYMTGLINPYYYKDNYNYIYNTIDISSGTYAMSGRCINGNINKASFYLTNKKDELKYYKENSKSLLKKANSLIDIYNINRKNEFNKYINDISDDIKNIYYNLPIYTISNELLDKILVRNNINNKDQKLIKEYVNSEKKRINKLLNNNKIIDEISTIDKNNFNLNLSLSGLFYDKKIAYTHEEYMEHLELIKKYKKENKNYNYKFINNNTFKNINISIINDDSFIISKENAPSIHFVFNNQKLTNAIKNFKVQIKD